MLKRTARFVGAGLRAIGRALPGTIVDAAGLAGVASISYGAWLIYVPAGFIVGGALLLIGAVRISTISRKAG